MGFEVEQREGTKRFRNDRLLLLPWETAEEPSYRDVRELGRGEKSGIVGSPSTPLSILESISVFIGWRGPEVAEAEVKGGRARFRASQKIGSD